MKLPESFYTRSDTVKIARELLGKELFCYSGGELTSGIITETEAYLGISDKASHAFGGRNTNRTAVMYQHGGVAYVYLCYGIHSLFNVVTNKAGHPHAVLIRSIIPTSGISTMLRRRNLEKPDGRSFTGPGKVTQALGIKTEMTGTSLGGNEIWISESKFRVNSNQIQISQRIGVDYAGSDALLPYRFCLQEK
jgi:DNA-3-methyladenine glycosylase